MTKSSLICELAGNVKLHVRVLPLADRLIAEIDAWWRENRPAARVQVTEQLAAAFDLLAHSPALGSLYPHPTIAGVRRYPLKSTPYQLYYVADEPAGELLVLALWSSMREHGPPLELD